MKGFGSELPVEIARDIYWIGSERVNRGLSCNPYLIKDGGRGVLIDPGSVLDFRTVLKKALKLLPLKKIDYIILHHQDPDLCSAVPLFEKKGFRGTIATHWRTSLLVQYYGTASPFYLVDEHGFELKLPGGRALGFVPAPYLHFPGAVMTYDRETGTLFSGDLFGAFGHESRLWADDRYEEAMKSFHEQYMPSADALRPVMELLSEMKISLIAPQHGSLIREDTGRYISLLRDLKCGGLLAPVHRGLVERGNYSALIDQVLARYYALYPRDTVIETFEHSAVAIDPVSGTLFGGHGAGVGLWNAFFDTVSSRRGREWLAVVYGMVRDLADRSGAPMPAVFESQALGLEQQLDSLKDDGTLFHERTRRMEEEVKRADESVVRDALTGLHNEEFMLAYLAKEIEAAIDLSFGMIFMELENVPQINNKFGRSAGDEAIAQTAYLLKNYIEAAETGKYHLCFKIEGARFAFYARKITRERLLTLAEDLMFTIIHSDVYLTPLTLAMGLVLYQEIFDPLMVPEESARHIQESGLMKIRIAKKSGVNMVYDQVAVEEFRDYEGRILLVDTDTMNIEVLKRELEEQGFRVLTCTDGHDALRMIEEQFPDTVISEIRLPRMDGFVIRRAMLQSSRLKEIPFMLLSYEKNDEQALRALSLNIRHYFQKPYSLAEVTGTAKLLVADRQSGV